MVFFFFPQTEDPAMERPYTFKDFLLRPRRLVPDGRHSSAPPREESGWLRKIVRRLTIIDTCSARAAVSVIYTKWDHLKDLLRAKSGRPLAAKRSPSSPTDRRPESLNRFLNNWVTVFWSMVVFVLLCYKHLCCVCALPCFGRPVTSPG